MNFGYSRADYEALTYKDRLFIRKAYETKTVTESTLLRDSVFNAIWNVMRKKGAGFKALWKKHTSEEERHSVEDDLAIVAEVEAKETNWVEQIYKANGWSLPHKK